jgi:integrase
MRRKDRGRKWILWWYDPPGSARYRVRTIGNMSDRMAREHQALLQAQLNGLAAGEDESAVTWEAFVARYLESAATGLKAPSLCISRQTLARFGRLVGPKFLSQVDRAMIEKYRVARAGKVSAITVVKDLRTLHAAFGWAVDPMGWLISNPVTKLRGHGRLRREDPDAMDAGQRQTFLARLDKKDIPTWIHASLRLAMLWGPRAGELAGILRQDIDGRALVLRIPVRGRRGTKEGRGKTVPLDVTTAGFLQELSHRDGPILWGPREKPLGSARACTEALGARCREILEEMSIKPQDNHPLQFLRRTAETRLRERGVPDWQIGAILGHGTRVGLQNYNGMTPTQVARQVADLGGET